MAKVELVMKEGKPIGWTIEGETPEEINIVNTIRNLQFYGIEETAIRYSGRTGKGQEYSGTLVWAQQRYVDDAVKLVIELQPVNEAG